MSSWDFFSFFPFFISLSADLYDDLLLHALLLDELLCVQLGVDGPKRGLVHHPLVGPLLALREQLAAWKQRKGTRN